MTNYLIDTHILLWHSLADRRLSKIVLDKLGSPESNLFVSQATYWEMTIKKALGKLDLTVPISDFYQSALENSFNVLPFDIEHYTVLESLPLLHSDPFDRMIIAQAISRDLTIITQDHKFEDYGDLVKILWN
jgi:PIN domain nuclease of toxin-antitoxin system